MSMALPCPSCEQDCKCEQDCNHECEQQQQQHQHQNQEHPSKQSPSFQGSTDLITTFPTLAKRASICFSYPLRPSFPFLRYLAATVIQRHVRKRHMRHDIAAFSNTPLQKSLTALFSNPATTVANQEKASFADMHQWATNRSLLACLMQLLVKLGVRPSKATASRPSQSLQIATRQLLSGLLLLLNPEALSNNLQLDSLQRLTQASKSIWQHIYRMTAHFPVSPLYRLHLQAVRQQWPTYHELFLQWKSDDLDALKNSLLDEFSALLSLESHLASHYKDEDVKLEWQAPLQERKTELLNSLSLLLGGNSRLANQLVDERIQQQQQQHANTTPPSETISTTEIAAHNTSTSLRGATAPQPLPLEPVDSRSSAKLTNARLAHELYLQPDTELPTLLEQLVPSKATSLQPSQRQPSPLTLDFADNRQAHMAALQLLVNELIETTGKPETSEFIQRLKNALDLSLLSRRLDAGFDLACIHQFILDLLDWMHQLCAPVRDADIESLKSDLQHRPASPLHYGTYYERIYETLRLMKMDLLQFSIQAIRPSLFDPAYLVPLELAAFKASLAYEPSQTRLPKTRQALTRLQAGSASSKKTEQLYPLLLKWTLDPTTSAEALPETCYMDRDRICNWKKQIENHALCLALHLILVPLIEKQATGPGLASLDRPRLLGAIKQALSSGPVAANRDRMAAVSKCLQAHFAEQIELTAELASRIESVVGHVLTKTAQGQPAHPVALLFHSRLHDALAQWIACLATSTASGNKNLHLLADHPPKLQKGARLREGMHQRSLPPELMAVDHHQISSSLHSTLLPVKEELDQMKASLARWIHLHTLVYYRLYESLVHETMST